MNKKLYMPYAIALAVLAGAVLLDGGLAQAGAILQSAVEALLG